MRVRDYNKLEFEEHGFTLMQTDKLRIISKKEYHMYRLLLTVKIATMLYDSTKGINDVVLNSIKFCILANVYHRIQYNIHMYIYNC